MLLFIWAAQPEAQVISQELGDNDHAVMVSNRRGVVSSGINTSLNDDLDTPIRS